MRTAASRETATVFDVAWLLIVSAYSPIYLECFAHSACSSLAYWQRAALFPRFPGLSSLAVRGPTGALTCPSMAKAMFTAQARLPAPMRGLEHTLPKVQTLTSCMWLNSTDTGQMYGSPRAEPVGPKVEVSPWTKAETCSSQESFNSEAAPRHSV